MTELKTLKDIKIEGANGRIRLKAEAIKDFKKWEKHPNGANVCSYIKWKNNLTDEDLEEEK